MPEPMIRLIGNNADLPSACCKGRLVGKGMTAEVYEWGPGLVIKLYCDWFKKEWIQHEANIGYALHQAGIPAPATYDIVEVEGRNGLIYERINGKSMLKSIEENPLKLFALARKMAWLHAAIHQGVSRSLPEQKAAMIHAITDSGCLSDEKTRCVLDYLNGLPGGVNVCHGDFHPDNILFQEGKGIAIDWNNACFGNPAADVARTLLIIDSPYMPPGTSPLLASLSRIAKSMLRSAYIRTYIKGTGRSLKDIEAWMLPAASARLRENLPAEREWLLGIIDRHLESLDRDALSQRA